MIDDDVRLTALLSEYLGKNGLTVLVANSPELGIKLVQVKRPNLVILDVMLPGKSGFEVCKEIRSQSSVPIIMLTARGDVTDRIVGLELGADDYMPKPFEPRELLARITTILRRSSNGQAPSVPLVYGTFRLDPESRRVLIDGQEIDLSTMEFDILHLLAASPTRIFNRDQIKSHLHGHEWSADDRSIDVTVSRVRQKLGDDPRKPRYLRTIRGTGYKFIGGHS